MNSITVTVTNEKQRQWDDERSGRRAGTDWHADHSDNNTRTYTEFEKLHYSMWLNYCSLTESDIGSRQYRQRIYRRRIFSGIGIHWYIRRNTSGRVDSSWSDPLDLARSPSLCAPVTFNTALYFGFTTVTLLKHDKLLGLQIARNSVYIYNADYLSTRSQWGKEANTRVEKLMSENKIWYVQVSQYRYAIYRDGNISSFQIHRVFSELGLWLPGCD